MTFYENAQYARDIYDRYLIIHLKFLAMKKVYIFIVCIFVAASCKNIQKMVDKGEYDKAIFYAVEKLQGEENKKIRSGRGAVLV